MKPNYRRCISCRRVEIKTDFWRVVRLHSSGLVQIDEGMGRSAYVCPCESCLKIARQKNRLGRALKASVEDGIYNNLWRRLKEPTAHKAEINLKGESHNPRDC